MASRPVPLTMTVLSSRKVTPSLLRLTLGGEGMCGFPAAQQGGYIKLRLAPEAGKTKPIVRTYTIRHQRGAEMDVDFALHGVESGSAGPATQWAMEAQTGAQIELAGPGAAKPLPEGFDFYLVAGDMTALPAISVNLEALDPQAAGLVVIEIQHEDDRQDIAAPQGVQIRWLINPTPGARPDMLEDAVRALAWPQGKVCGWVACEFSAMRRLRVYLREERGMGPQALYISSYWKSGLTEEGHKLAKREDAESTSTGG